MSRNSFDILASVCRELDTINIHQQEESEKDWDDHRYNATSILLLKCATLSKAFREAAIPFIFRTINLDTSWPTIEVRMEALKKSDLLKRYVRTVRFFAPKFTTLDIIHTRFRWIFREFATILSALPLLQAVAITSEDLRVPELIQQSFASVQFVGFLSARHGPPSRQIELPTVTDISIDNEFRFITECCPNLRRVSGTGTIQPLPLVQAVATRAQLESISLHTWMSPFTIRGLSTWIPQLQELRLPGTHISGALLEHFIAAFASFRHLSRLLVQGLGRYSSGQNSLSPRVITRTLDEPEETLIDTMQHRIPTLQEIQVRRRVYARAEEQHSMKLIRS